MSESWTAEDVKNILQQSSFGKQLLESCDCNIVALRPNRDDLMNEDPDTNGYYRQQQKVIVLNANRNIYQAVATLAHEAEHARQGREGEIASPKEFLYESTYHKYCGVLEARAESSANRVLVELAQSGIEEPLNQALKSNNRQTLAYYENFHQSRSHEEAATASEPYWARRIPDYAPFFREEWSQKNEPNAIQMPMQSFGKEDEFFDFERFKTSRALNGQKFAGEINQGPMQQRGPSKPRSRGEVIETLKRQADEWAKEKGASREHSNGMEPDL
jgi:hypothetical protein